jgi:dihydrolipoamide dehydrogenase
LAVTSYDIVIVGASPGKHVVAIDAAQPGYKDAWVEEANPGGVCLNIGRIPTRALLERAAMITHPGHAREFGVAIGESRTDLASVGRALHI